MTPLTMTIIIPTHNRFDEFQNAVRSILDQTRKPDAVIVVHDGAGEIAEDTKIKFEQAGIKYKYIKRANPSLTASRNAGLDACDTAIAIFGEDDALFDSNFCKRAEEFFQADAARQIACIGANIIEPHLQTKAGKIWSFAANFFCQVRWRPRVCKARYIKLPRAISHRLKPSLLTAGAGICLRMDKINRMRFNENLTGAAFGEDRDFSYRLTQQASVFYSPELILTHHPGPGGRGDMVERGKIYVHNSLLIFSNATEKGAGTAMFLAWDLIGTIFLYTLAGLAGLQKENLKFAGAMLAELFKILLKKIGGMLR